ncbi:unnamed protein product [Paramecium octaurelia]|uniref:Uncharacterized protein n=1 Tax=Paramecium octaurelia TaxID=43137 RepID=A0A8S1TZ54_PAROT|nr:unnamed protein product [Paramecium octaurelia]
MQSNLNDSSSVESIKQCKSSEEYPKEVENCFINFIHASNDQERGFSLYEQAYQQKDSSQEPKNDDEYREHKPQPKQIETVSKQFKKQEDRCSSKSSYKKDCQQQSCNKEVGQKKFSSFGREIKARSCNCQQSNCLKGDGKYFTKK